MSLEEIIETIDDETCLQDDDFQDPDMVKDDLCDIAEENDDVRQWVDDVGIDTAVKLVIEHNRNPYKCVNNFANLVSKVMEAEGHSKESISECIGSIYEQFNVPNEHRRNYSNTKEKE